MNWRTAGRVLMQGLLVAPMIAMYPFALMLAVMSPLMLGSSEFGPGRFAMVAAQLLAPIGLTFLFLSIVLTTRLLRSPHWREWMTAGLVCGLVATIIWQGTLLAEPDASLALVFNPWSLYTFGGAVVVALWNLWRAWRREDRLAATPTPVASADV